VTTLAGIVSVLLVAAGLYFTNAANRSTSAATLAQQKLAEQGLITERFSRATDQLGSDKIDVRLGAIYSLQRLMADSPADFATIVAVLGAYVRDHAPAPKPHSPTSAPPATDVQAVLTVLGESRAAAHGVRMDLSDSNLSHAALSFADLDGADLSGSDLTGADLGSADLIRAYLIGAYLSDAYLGGANLTAAILVNTSLIGAILGSTNLTNANLRGADLTGVNLGGLLLGGTNLTGANLTGANLTGANLTATIGLNRSQLTGAYWSSKTTFPPGFVLATPAASTGH
jgi:hypothetical protein